MTVEPDLGDATQDTAGPSIRLEVVTGPMDGQNHFRFAASFTLGRGSGCDLQLPLDPTLAPVHARLFVADGRLWLEDLGAAAGTFLGGQRLREPCEVAPGTLFRVGRTTVAVLDLSV